MWLQKKMLHIPWIAKQRKEDVLEEAETDRETLRTIRQQQMQLTRHNRRVREMEDMCLTSKIQEKRERG